MAAPATPQFFTYRKDVPLKGGTTLAFEAGKGYYAKPAGQMGTFDPSPGQIKMTPQPKPQQPTLDQQAAKQALDTVSASSVPIQSQQSAYDAQAEQRRQAYVELAKAAAALLGPMGASLQSGYDTAAEENKSIAAPLSEGVRATLASEQGANRDFVNSIVQGADPSRAPDPQAVKDALYSLNGRIPSEKLSAQGLAGLTWGVQQPGIALAKGADDLRAYDTTVNQQDDQYRQQLKNIAAQYPDLRAKALAALQQYDLDQKKYALSERAQGDIEKRLGIDTQYKSDTLLLRQQTVDLQRQGLKLRQQKQASDLQKQQIDMQRIDPGASRVAGHIVLKDGSVPVDSKGQPISVAASTSGSPAKGYQKAVAEAVKLRGVPAQNRDVGPGSPGRYLAVPGASGKDVYPAHQGFSATTDNAQKAAYTGTMNFAQAQTYLQNAYGLTRSKARAALIAAGWRPGT
jgi:hypothetical protein